jgi:FkbM family methyltransferase
MIDQLVKVLVNTPIGEREFLRRDTKADEAVVSQTFKQGQFLLSFTHGKWLEKLYDLMIQRGEKPLVIDGGGNIGTAAVCFATKFPKAHIVSVEPDSENFSLIERNCAGLDVDPVHAALVAIEGYLVVTDLGRGEWGYVTRPEGDGERVPAITLKKLVQDKKSAGYSPFILKLDIEGAEKDLFDGDIAWFHDFPYVIIETHDSMTPGQATSRSFLLAHTSKPRDLIIRGENLISVDTLVKQTLVSA